MTPKKDAAAIAEAARSQGFRVKVVTSGHYHFWDPRGNYVCDLGSTPSKTEITRKRSKLRKAGLRI